MTSEEVNYPKFDASEFSKKNSPPVQTLLSNWIVKPVSSNKGKAMLFIYSIVTILGNKDCILPLIQSASEFMKHCNKRELMFFPVCKLPVGTYMLTER